MLEKVFTLNSQHKNTVNFNILKLDILSAFFYKCDRYPRTCIQAFFKFLDIRCGDISLKSQYDRKPLNRLTRCVITYHYQRLG